MYYSIGISLVDETVETSDESSLQVADGIQVAYLLPIDDCTPESSTGGATAATELSLDELMAKMKNIG